MTQTHNHPRHGHGENAKTDYTYDKNGNLIKKEEPSRSSRDKTTTLYSYDYENRLTRVDIQRGHRQKVVTFTYDPFGRRLTKTVHREELEEDEEQREEGPGCDDERRAPRTTYYLYDNEDIVAEYDDKGETTARYIHGPGIDEPLAMERKGKVYYFHADGLGSITALTDRHGKEARKYDYDSFGNMTSKQDRFGQPYTYTGREGDKETGLYYYRARYYDPAAGRFISKDPIGFAGGDVNLYGYVQNNPVNYTDPDGNFAIVVGPAVVAVTGITAATLIWMIYHPPKPLPSPIVKENDDWRKDIDLDNWDGIKDLFPPPPPPRIDRCKQVEEECYAECTASVLGCKGSKYDQGTKFRNCIRDCKAKHGC